MELIREELSGEYWRVVYQGVCGSVWEGMCVPKTGIQPMSVPIHAPLLLPAIS